MSDQKNIIVAIVLSVAILFGFQFLYEMPRQQAHQEYLRQQKALTEQTTPPANPDLPPLSAGQTGTATPGAAGSLPDAGGLLPGAIRDRGTVLGESPRMRIDTPKLHGSINLTGARFDDLTLADYRVSIEPGSPEVVLLAPRGTAQPYFADFGWIGQAADGAPVAIPGPDTVWQASADTLRPGQPVTLGWDNGQGLRFERTVAVDDNYMFTVTQRVVNSGGAAVTVQPYGRVQRIGTPQTSGFFILHEGPIGVLDGVLEEYEYSDLREDPTPTEVKSTGGWIGFTDKYWLVTLIPDQQAAVDVRLLHQGQSGQALYQVDYRPPATALQPGEVTESTHRLFAGAKVVDILDSYEEQLGIARFTYAVDWGWFYFLTKPFFYVLDWLATQFGNFGVAILVFTVLLRLAFFPLANKQYESFAKMKKLQPKLEELKKRYGDDRQQFSMKMMELYKAEKVNPLGGCLPILLQIPIFFALYKVLFVTIEMRHAPFFWYIRDLSAADPTSVFNLFGLIPWDPPSFLMLGFLPLLMGASMWIQFKLNPSQPDPVQQKVFMLMPIIFTFFSASFPAGLVIYWTWTNVLSILQQAVIMRRLGVKVDLKP